MLPPVTSEENVQKVINWILEDVSRYPVTGQRALNAANELGVSYGETNIANRRIRFGLVPLVQKPVIKIAKASEPKSQSAVLKLSKEPSSKSD